MTKLGNLNYKAGEPLNFPEQVKDITELCFRKIKLVSVYGIIYVRSYLIYLIQVSLRKYFVMPLFP